MVHLSAGEWVIYGIFVVAWAFLGYRLSENDRRVLGRTPWGLPSVLWAIFWVLFGLFGMVLYLIAHFVGVRHAQRKGPYRGVPGPVPPSTMTKSPNGRTPSASDMFPAYPRPANSTPAEVDESDAVLPGDPGARADWTNSPPAWHPDPSGRFHYRWWNGTQWTSQVSTDGHHLVDTNPDQRIGPY